MTTLFNLTIDNSIRKDSRMALLTSKRNIESRSKSNRDELFALNAPGKEQFNEKSSYAFPPNAHSQISDCL